MTYTVTSMRTLDQAKAFNSTKTYEVGGSVDSQSRGFICFRQCKLKAVLLFSTMQRSRAHSRDCIVSRNLRQSSAKNLQISRRCGAGEGRVRTTIVIHHPARWLSHFVKNCQKRIDDGAAPTWADAGIIVIPDVAYTVFEQNGACCLDHSSLRLDRGE